MFEHKYANAFNLFFLVAMVSSAIAELTMDLPGLTVIGISTVLALIAVMVARFFDLT